MSTVRAEKILQLQLDWVRAADSKVPPLFAINIAMLGLMAALVKSLPAWTISVAIPCSIAAILIFFSLFFLAFAVFPRLDGPKESNVFFKGIVKQSEKTFKANFSSATDLDIQDDLLNQAYRNAEIADKKYSNIKLAFICTFCSIPLWIFSVFLLYI